MNPKQLLQHFDRISEAPDAIVRLRRFILDLAVRGKLVEQDPNDEPAAELLKRIQAEKARLGLTPRRQGAKKSEKADQEMLGDLAAWREMPFAIPSTWVWVQLDEITSYIQRGKSPIYATDDGLPVISQKCVQWRGLDLSVARLITKESINKYEDVRFLRKNDLLWNSTGTGTIGRVVKVITPPDKLVCDSHVTVVRCLLIDAEYVRSWLRSDHVYKLIEDQATGSTNQVELTAQMANKKAIPLPPLAEQHRIVAKVDELMALCDQLEAAQTKREQSRDRLVAASLHQLQDSNGFTPRRQDAKKDKKSEQENLGVLAPWRESLFLQNLPRLTTRPAHIKQLRQTILNLAVRGKLVEQDPNDEPASELLKRIQAEKEKLGLTPRRKGAKKSGKADQETLGDLAAWREMPFSVPESWEWQYIVDLSVLVTDGEHATPPRIPEQQIPLVTAKNVRNGEMDYATTDWVSFDTAEKAWRRCRPLVGDILLVCVGATTGRLCILREPKDMVLVRSVALIRPSNVVDVDFLGLAIQSQLGQSQIWNSVKVTAQPCLYINMINSLAFPLPPLAEQHRIVAKVDELMALCDQLETQLNTTEADSRSLLEAVLHEALAPVLEVSTQV